MEGARQHSSLSQPPLRPAPGTAAGRAGARLTLVPAAGTQPPNRPAGGLQLHRAGSLWVPAGDGPATGAKRLWGAGATLVEQAEGTAGGPGASVVEGCGRHRGARHPQHGLHRAVQLATGDWRGGGTELGGVQQAGGTENTAGTGPRPVGGVGPRPGGGGYPLLGGAPGAGGDTPAGRPASGAGTGGNGWRITHHRRRGRGLDRGSAGPVARQPAIGRATSTEGVRRATAPLSGPRLLLAGLPAAVGIGGLSG